MLVFFVTECGAHPRNVGIHIVCELWQLLQEVRTLLLNIEHCLLRLLLNITCLFSSVTWCQAVYMLF